MAKTVSVICAQLLVARLIFVIVVAINRVTGKSGLSELGRGIQFVAVNRKSLRYLFLLLQLLFIRSGCGEMRPTSAGWRNLGCFYQ